MLRHSRWKARGPRRPGNGIKARSRRGSFGDTWWSRQWLRTVESETSPERWIRGRSYARNGQVKSVSIVDGVVRAEVQGSRVRPYSVEIRPANPSARAREAVLRAIASGPGYTAPLLSRHIPEGLDQVFRDKGLNMFPGPHSGLVCRCSCPDWGDPCKHVVAVLLLIGERMDEDPFVLLGFTGIKREDLAAAVDRSMIGHVTSAQETEEALPDLSDLVGHFWSAGPGFRDIKIDIAPPAIEHRLLGAMGEPPWGGETLTAYLKMCYTIATRIVLARVRGRRAD